MSNAAPATDGPDRSAYPSMLRSSWTGTGAGQLRVDWRAEGHRRNVEALRRVVRAAHELGIVYLTIFRSRRKTGRGRRPRSAIFGLLRRFITMTLRRCIATACG
jgi:undecaprenyl diphosphate synthase